MLHFELLRPLLLKLNRPLILLSDFKITTYQIGLPENIINIDYSALVCNKATLSNLSGTKNVIKFNTLIKHIFEHINIEGVILSDSTHYQDRELRLLADKYQIPSYYMIDKNTLRINLELNKILANRISKITHQHSIILRSNNNFFTLKIIDEKNIVEYISNVINNLSPISYNINLKKLHIGCGHNILDGWINIDKYIEHSSIIQIDAAKILPFPSNRFEYIFTEHMIEHLSLKEQCMMLNECKRVLKPKGVLRIATPNFNSLMDLYNHPNNSVNTDYLNWSFDNFISNDINIGINKEQYPIFVINNFMHDWGHKFIHNPDSLQRLGEAIGFSEIQLFNIGHSYHSDLQNLECHQNSIPAWANQFETFVMEMKK